MQILDKTVVNCRKRALFVSRFLPDMTAHNLEYCNKDCTPLDSLQCTKMKSKYPEKYSSFRAFVNEDEYESLKKAENWPKGSLALLFFGKPKLSGNNKDRVNNLLKDGLTEKSILLQYDETKE